MKQEGKLNYENSSWEATSIICYQPYQSQLNLSIFLKNQFIIVWYAYSKRDRSQAVFCSSGDHELWGRKRGGKKNWVVNDFIGLINDHYLSLFELSQSAASSSWPWCCVGWLAGIQNCHQPAHPLPIAIMKIVHFIFKTDPQRQVSRSLAHSRTLYEAPLLGK